MEFATESGDIEITQHAIIDDKNMDLDIISINTSRDVGADDTASFNIVLVYKDKWYYNIRSNDFVKISLGRGYEAEPVLFGLVDSVQKSWEFIDLEPVRTINISGRGFNKATIQFGIGAIEEIDQSYKVEGFFDSQSDAFSQSSPSEVIKAVFNFYADKGINMQFANGNTWRSYVKTIFIDSGIEESLMNLRNYYTYQGGLWDYIKELRNAPFNEAYWEVVDGNPTFIVRPTPFNPEYWNSLNLITLDDIDLVNANMGRNDLETYTVFQAKSENFVNKFNLTLGLPVWYKPHYRKYGIRRLSAESKYAPYGEIPDYLRTGYTTDGRKVYDKDYFGFDASQYTESEMGMLKPGLDAGANAANMYSNMTEHMGLSPVEARLGLSPQQFIFDKVNAEYNQETLQKIDGANAISNFRGGSSSFNQVSQKTIDLFNWNIKNADMESGLVTVKGHVKYKVGERLFMKSTAMEYYIENVGHQFIYNENWTTNLEVTRGLLPQDRFTSPWNEWAIFTENDVAEIMGIDPSEIIAPYEPTPDLEDTPKPTEPTEKPKEPTPTPGEVTISDNLKYMGNGLIFPVPANVQTRVTSTFGKRSAPTAGASTNHQGVDYSVPQRTPLVAPFDGEIVRADFGANGGGGWAQIKGKDGLIVGYIHVNEHLVKKGDKVKAGQVIAYSGGQKGTKGAGTSTGAHLHLEVKKDGVYVNPEHYFK